MQVADITLRIVSLNYNSTLLEMLGAPNFTDQFVYRVRPFRATVLRQLGADTVMGYMMVPVPTIELAAEFEINGVEFGDYHRNDADNNNIIELPILIPSRFGNYTLPPAVGGYPDFQNPLYTIYLPCFDGPGPYEATDVAWRRYLGKIVQELQDAFSHFDEARIVDLEAVHRNAFLYTFPVHIRPRYDAFISGWPQISSDRFWTRVSESFVSRLRITCLQLLYYLFLRFSPDGLEYDLDVFLRRMNYLGSPNVLEMARLEAIKIAVERIIIANNLRMQQGGMDIEYEDINVRIDALQPGDPQRDRLERLRQEAQNFNDDDLEAVNDWLIRNANRPITMDEARRRILDGANPLTQARRAMEAQQRNNRPVINVGDAPVQQALPRRPINLDPHGNPLGGGMDMDDDADSIRQDSYVDIDDQADAQSIGGVSAATGQSLAPPMTIERLIQLAQRDPVIAQLVAEEKLIAPGMDERGRIRWRRDLTADEAGKIYDKVKEAKNTANRMVSAEGILYDNLSATNRRESLVTELMTGQSAVFVALAESFRIVGPRVIWSRFCTLLNLPFSDTDLPGDIHQLVNALLGQGVSTAQIIKASKAFLEWFSSAKTEFRNARLPFVRNVLKKAAWGRESDAVGYQRLAGPQGAGTAPITKGIPTSSAATALDAEFRGVSTTTPILQVNRQFSSLVDTVNTIVDTDLFKQKEVLLNYRMQTVLGALNSLRSKLKASSMTRKPVEAVLSRANAPDLGQQGYYQSLSLFNTELGSIWPVNIKIRITDKNWKGGKGFGLYLITREAKAAYIAPETNRPADAATAADGHAVTPYVLFGGQRKTNYEISLAPYYGYVDTMYAPIKVPASSNQVMPELVSALNDGVPVVSAANKRVSRSMRAVADATELSKFSVNLVGRGYLSEMETVIVSSANTLARTMTSVYTARWPVRNQLDSITGAQLFTLGNFTDYIIRVPAVYYTRGNIYILVSLASEFKYQQVSVDQLRQFGLDQGIPNGELDVIINDYEANDVDAGGVRVQPAPVNAVLQAMNLEGERVQVPVAPVQALAGVQGAQGGAQGGQGGAQVRANVVPRPAQPDSRYILLRANMPLAIEMKAKYNRAQSMITAAVTELFRAFDTVSTIVASAGKTNRAYETAKSYFLTALNNIKRISLGSGESPPTNTQIQNLLDHATFYNEIAKKRGLENLSKSMHRPLKITGPGFGQLVVTDQAMLETHLSARLNEIATKISQVGPYMDNLYIYWPKDCDTGLQVAGGNDVPVKFWVEGFANRLDWIKYIQLMNWIRAQNYSSKQERTKINKNRITKFIKQDTTDLKKLIYTFGGQPSDYLDKRNN